MRLATARLSGWGKPISLMTTQEKITMLHQLMARFSDKTFTFPAANVKATQVVRIDIDSLKGKQHGYWGSGRRDEDCHIY